ncbi:hypothetical protein O181_124590 [Austropuccinia psidii MF-1]|uniref:Uncharacterized protein n=1 Tax=Austropuccinia psidii MF-1 TaxID=1389203 RepID=A0A9Q3KTD4_9BASI|nr:hypothetical protein [Austropuccinia psidii MF-1]
MTVNLDARNHQQGLELSTQGHVGTGGPPPPPGLHPRLLDCAIITTEQKRLQDQGLLSWVDFTIVRNDTLPNLGVSNLLAERAWE